MNIGIKRASLALFAALGLGTCVGCAGNAKLTETQQAVVEIADAAETVDQKAWAAIGIYYDVLEQAKVDCAKPATPVETCAALEVAFDATAERVATASDVWASVISYRAIYGELRDAKAPADKIEAAKSALDQGLRDWATLRPKIEQVIKLGESLPSAE